MRDQRLVRLTDELESFVGLLNRASIGQAYELSSLLDAYIHTRATLTRSIAELAASKLTTAEAELRADLAKVEAAMNIRLQENGWRWGHVPVKGYNKTHALLLGYLRSRSGNVATIAELRLVIGDQVHTERRLRDLRDVGFRITALKRGGQHAYELANSVCDISAAVLSRLRVLAKDKKRSPAERKIARELSEAGQI